MADSERQMAVDLESQAQLLSVCLWQWRSALVAEPGGRLVQLDAAIGAETLLARPLDIRRRRTLHG